MSVYDRNWRRLCPGRVLHPVLPHCGYRRIQPEDIRIWGDFWIENYNQVGDTLKTVSGGSHPGCMHVKKAEDGFEVTSFDAVGDGSQFDPTAKAIFGDRYQALIDLWADEDAKQSARSQSIRDYAKANDLNVSYYQDYGWPAVKIEE